MIKTFKLPSIPFKGKIEHFNTDISKLQNLASFVKNLSSPAEAELHYSIQEGGVSIRKFGGSISPVEKLNPFPELLHEKYPNYVIVLRNLIALDIFREEVLPLKDLFFQHQPFPFAHLAATISDEGGSIGYHLDNYNVVIFQFTGKRRWHLWDPSILSSAEKAFFIRENSSEPVNHVLLKKRDPDHVFELEENEYLYIPALFPHEGQTCTGSGRSISFSFVWQALSGFKLLDPIVKKLFPDQSLRELVKNDANPAFYDIIDELPLDKSDHASWLAKTVQSIAAELKPGTVFTDKEMHSLVNYWLRIFQ